LNSYTCDCTGTGYTGQYCEIKRDYCLPNPCKNGGECKNRLTDFICTCKPGYSGVDCSKDCDDCDPNPCVNGKCTDLSDGYKCECDPGWEGPNCDKNIDDCECKPCRNNAVC